MLKKLRLERFKNFADVELTLGPLSFLIGENASGKSNIREAFRFLHAISRGYTLSDIMGEKWLDGGVLQWRGIRGGLGEIAFQGAESFAIEATFAIKDEKDVEQEVTYRIEANLGVNGELPYVADEKLSIEGWTSPVFQLTKGLHRALTLPGGIKFGENINLYLSPLLGTYTPLSKQYPFLPTEIKNKRLDNTIQDLLQSVLKSLGNMRFLDLSPEAMRRPSLPGQTILGDRGENLSSVLQQICAQPQGKETLVQWIQELTPMDAQDFEFVSDLTGRTLLVLVERNGQRTSAYSASDGTLRFLAMIAALLGPSPARFYFFEELDNGLHPSRLHLLLQLIEQKVKHSDMQIVATTHSSQLLNVISPATLDAASLIYRLEERADAQIKRIVDIPDAPRVLQKYEPAQLHAMGWFEDTVAFSADEEE